MRRAAKIDTNHTEIVSAFRKLGCSVLPLHTVGGGCPDIAVGKHSKTVLVEIKDGNKSSSRKKFTKDEEKFHEEWLGSVFVVESVEDVIALVKALER